MLLIALVRYLSVQEAGNLIYLRRSARFFSVQEACYRLPQEPLASLGDTGIAGRSVSFVLYLLHVPKLQVLVVTI